MNTTKIRILTKALDRLRRGRFTLSTEGMYFTPDYIIKFYKEVKYPFLVEEQLQTELNNAIKPILNKYEKLIEQEIKKEVNDD